jgi:hypothetical protein
MSHCNNQLFEDRMSFFIAVVLGTLAAILYFHGPGWPLQTFCDYTFELCQHPTWPLYGAIAFGLAGLLFRAGEM